MNRHCLFCTRPENVFLELVVWQLATGERTRDIVGGVCSECATILENRATASVSRPGDDLTTWVVDTAQVSGPMMNSFGRMRGLHKAQFGIPPNTCGYRFVPFTHVLGMQMWKRRRDEEDKAQAKVNGLELPEVIRASPEEHGELVREAIRDIQKKNPAS